LKRYEGVFCVNVCSVEGSAELLQRRGRRGGVVLAFSSLQSSSLRSKQMVEASLIAVFGHSNLVEPLVTTDNDNHVFGKPGGLEFENV